MTYLVTLIDCLILAAGYILFIFPRYLYDKRKTFLYFLFYTYLCLVILITLLPVIPSFDEPSINLIPFRDIINEYGDAHIQAILNVIMFIPLGIFIPMIYKSNGFKVIFIGFLCSFTIEVLQPWITINRVCDVTDLITNTCGAAVGYILYAMVSACQYTAADEFS